MTDRKPIEIDVGEGVFTCGVKYISFANPPYDPATDDDGDYTHIAERPQGMSDDNWGVWSDFIVARLNAWPSTSAAKDNIGAVPYGGDD